MCVYVYLGAAGVIKFAFLVTAVYNTLFPQARGREKKKEGWGDIGTSWFHDMERFHWILDFGWIVGGWVWCGSWILVGDLGWAELG